MFTAGILYDAMGILQALTLKRTFLVGCAVRKDDHRRVVTTDKVCFVAVTVFTRPNGYYLTLGTTCNRVTGGLAHGLLKLCNKRHGVVTWR